MRWNCGIVCILETTRMRAVKKLRTQNALEQAEWPFLIKAGLCMNSTLTGQQRDPALLLPSSYDTTGN